MNLGRVPLVFDTVVEHHDLRCACAHCSQAGFAGGEEPLLALGLCKLEIVQGYGVDQERFGRAGAKLLLKGCQVGFPSLDDCWRGSILLGLE
jgi:hypothetical protein